MPIRVPEGPIDPYEPFPFDGPAVPSWSRAPIVKGRDVAGVDGRDAVPERAPVADEARFVDIEEIAAGPPPLNAWRFADDVLATAPANDGATEVDEINIHGGGDSSASWLLVDVAGPEAPEYAPHDLPVEDPWAVVTAQTAGDGIHAEPEAPPPAPDGTPAIEPRGALDYDVLRRAGGPPMSSRAILMVGSLALVCLALAAALAFQAIREPEPTAPALDAPAGADAAAAPASTSGSNLRSTLLESLPVSDTTLTSIERAAVGPLEGELQRLGSALRDAFGRSSTEVAPVLRPYVAHAAERMRTHPARFRLVVTAPDAELAAARADAIMHAFEGAGLPADMLTMTAEAGAPDVTFDR